MTPTEHPINKIYQGDSQRILKTLPDEFVDCVVTSPPYWALRDYGIEGQIWGGAVGCSHEWGEKLMPRGNKSGKPGPNATVGARFAQDDYRRGKGTDFCIKCGAWRGSLGLEPTFDLYIKHLCDIFDEVKRLLKKSGTCWVNMGDTYNGSGGSHKDYMKNDTGFQGKYRRTAQPTRAEMPSKCLLQIPARFSIEMCNRGWILRNTLIWHKPNCMPSSIKDRFTVDFEYVFFFVKNKEYWFERQFEVLDEGSLARANRAWYGSKHDGNYAGRKKKERGEDIDRWAPKQGRNKRCVWKITTKPFKDAHFAVFPEELIETPLFCGYRS